MKIDDIFLKNVAKKFNLLQNKYLHQCENKFNENFKNGLNLFYSKYNCGDIEDIFSKSILRHIDMGKCLYKQPSNRIRENTTVSDYYMLYYNSNHELIMSELSFFYPKIATIYVNKNVQISYLLNNNVSQFRSLEYTEYIDGKIVSCEKFIKLYQPPYGIKINGEYYEYDNSTLITALKFENYNTTYEPFCNPALKLGLVPGRILNPDIFYYEFKYEDAEKLICKKTHEYTSENLKTQIITLKKCELIKLKKFNVDCFNYVNN